MSPLAPESHYRLLSVITEVRPCSSQFLSLPPWSLNIRTHFVFHLLEQSPEVFTLLPFLVGFLVIFTLGYQGCPAWSLGLMSKCLLSQKKLRLALHESPDSKFSPPLAGGWKGQLHRRALIWYLPLSGLVLVLNTVVLPRSTLEHFPWDRSFC